MLLEPQTFYKFNLFFLSFCPALGHDFSGSEEEIMAVGRQGVMYAPWQEWYNVERAEEFLSEDVVGLHWMTKIWSLQNITSLFLSFHLEEKFVFLL